MRKRGTKNFPPDHTQLGSRRQKLIDKAAIIYLDHLPEKDFPREEQLRSAIAEITDLVREELCERSWLEQIGNSPAITEEDTLVIGLDFEEWIAGHPLQIPLPALVSELSGWKLAWAAMIGAVGGSLLLSGLFKLLMSSPDPGVLIGGPAGAAALVMAVWYASQSRKIRLAIQSALGVASLAELWIVFASTAGLGGIWRALRGTPGSKMIPGFVKRIFLYLAVILFLKLAVRKPTYDRGSYRATVTMVLGLWVENAIQFLAVRLQHSKAPATETENKVRNALKQLGVYLHKIHQSSREYLADTAAELLVKARSLGIEGLEGSPAFISGEKRGVRQMTWNKSLEEKYQGVGAVEEGDLVFIEQHPLIHEGKVIEKGLVRKVREKR